MLAQSFQSAADLGITEPQKDALIKTLVLLETGKLVHVELPRRGLDNAEPKFDGHFNMLMWAVDHPSCGTVMCIGGTAEAVGNVSMGQWINHRGLKQLFRPNIPSESWRYITPSQAARALRSYLTTGDAKWAEAVSV